MAKRLFQFIILAMILGIVTGAAVHASASPETARDIAGWFKIVTDIFLRLIKMIIAPLVLTTLIVGIAHMGDAKTLGRVGFRTIAWFIGASLVSLSLGLLMVNVLHPGAGFSLDQASTADAAPTAEAFTLAGFITHLVPRSIIEAMATNEILQIVVFSVFAGTALAALGEKTRRVTELLEQGAFVMLRITEYVMLLAPFAVFAAVAGVISIRGLGVIITYGAFVGGFYLSLVILWIVLSAAGAAVIGGGRMKSLLGVIREPVTIAFSTASSEAAYPKLLEKLERFGVSNRVASFVLPLGYSFNLDGSMMYCAFATLFIAQANGIEITAGQQIAMLLLLMITSKGMAGVPRASLVVIAATLSFLKLPEEGLLLILAVDHFLDMGRSATNVVGNSVATAAVAKWEGQLRDPAVDRPVIEEALEPRPKPAE
ncbi:MAG: dicarboxylate/amino acid:cation symporter [Parvularculaceae bacterium]|nr:dicarboxylate/amino acid:cation symporter [Parvularculaceae bacterium]